MIVKVQKGSRIGLFQLAAELAQRVSNDEPFSRRMSLGPDGALVPGAKQAFLQSEDVDGDAAIWRWIRANQVDFHKVRPQIQVSAGCRRHMASTWKLIRVAFMQASTLRGRGPRPRR